MQVATDGGDDESREASRVLNYRMRSTLVARMDGLVRLMALDGGDNRVGFVGVGLDEEVASALVNATSIADGRTGPR